MEGGFSVMRGGALKRKRAQSPEEATRHIQAAIAELNESLRIIGKDPMTYGQARFHFYLAKKEIDTADIYLMA